MYELAVFLTGYLFSVSLTWYLARRVWGRFVLGLFRSALIFLTVITVVVFFLYYHPNAFPVLVSEVYHDVPLTLKLALMGLLAGNVFPRMTRRWIWPSR